MTDSDIKQLPLEERKWFLNRLAKQMQEENDQINGNQSQNNIPSGKQAIPKIPPSILNKVNPKK